MPGVKSKTGYGKLGEELALQILARQGYKILDKNFHSRFGEIDIIALKDQTLVFVEVKARWSSKFGAPQEAITKKKLEKIIKTGQYYSLLHPQLPKKLRIDVVALEISKGRLLSAKLIPVY